MLFYFFRILTKELGKQFGWQTLVSTQHLSLIPEPYVRKLGMVIFRSNIGKEETG